MKLEGIHHITAITGDAPAQRRLLHARPRPAAGQEERQPGRPDRLPPLLRRRAGQRRLGPDLLRVPGRRARARRARDGAPDRLARRVRGRALLLGRAARGRGRAGRPARAPGALRFRDPEGLEHELVVDDSGDDPLIADHPEVPAEHALRGFDGVRAYAQDAEQQPRRCSSRRSRSSRPGDGWEIRGAAARQHLRLRPAARPRAGIQGAGTIHHVAWASPDGRPRGVARARSCARAGARRR